LKRSIIPAVAAFLLLGAAADAQPSTANDGGKASPPATTSPDGQAGTPVKPLTVSGQQPNYRRYIDRRSYSLTADLHATNGSIGDALRNIPSVDVNPQGEISLRGDASVTIMVDGQPSALFRGRSRAAALEQIPADQYERVEVITNPSAAFKPDGTGGIINLISKKSRHQKPTATISVSANSGGWRKAALSGTFASGGLSVTANGGYSRYTSRTDQQTTETLVDPGSGASAAVTSASQARTKSFYGHGGASADDDLDSNTRVSASVDYGAFAAQHTLFGSYRSSATSGVLAQDYNNDQDTYEAGSNIAASASYRRQLGGDDHEIDLDLQYSDDAFRSDDRQRFDYQLPVQPNLFQNILSDTGRGVADLKAEYHKPLPGQAKLLVGYEFEYDQNFLDNDVLLGTDGANAATSPTLSNRFGADQSVHDLYATYERPFGRFDVMPGLRLEAVILDLDQITTGERDSTSYLEAYPTLHTSYRLNSAMQLTASYSRRVDRPDLSQFNPFRVYNNPLSFSQGNPRLKPAITDSYEAAFEYGEKSVYYLATLYYRNTQGLVSPVTENLGDGELLGTYDNIGHSRNAGAELVANGPITKTLSYSFTTDAFWNELTDPDAPNGPPRSGAVFTFEPKLKWDVTPNDFVQLNVYASTRAPTAQGYTSGYVYSDIGYRHRFGHRLSLVAQWLDPTNGLRFTTVTDTPTLQQRSASHYLGNFLSLGLTYDLGGTPKPAPKEMDFGGGGSPAH